MKPLSKAIIYDSSCPMCQAYTKGFVKWGILAPEHRISFCELEPDQAQRYMDLTRSKHEIPLVDLSGGKTLYGIEALSYLLSQRLPFIQTFLSCKPIHWFCQKLYSFISYNRRVITATTSENKGIDCKPDFHLSYRLLFIFFGILIASLITWKLGSSTSAYSSSLSGYSMLLICGSGWLIQMIAAISILKGQERIEYLGQLATLMLIGTWVLLPGLWIDSLTHHSSILWISVSVLISSILMHTEHIRRLRYLHLSIYWLFLWSAALFGTALAELWLFTR